MAYITLDAAKLYENYISLDDLFKKHEIRWSIVTKMLCGNKVYLQELLKFPGIRQICDSRVSNLKTIKSLRPDVETIYIKPPAKRSISDIVRYADISMNTEFRTIKMLSDEAVRQNKTHRVMIMIELGELREGVMREDFVKFYERVFELPNIEVVALGANLSCLYGVLPNQDKLIQLALYKELIEARFGRKLPCISGGSSVTIPLIHYGILPKGINHFRVGETLYLGTDVYNDEPFEHMHNDVFQLYAEIIELMVKPTVPVGDMGTNLEGKTFESGSLQSPKETHRALIDIGLLDVDTSHIKPVDETLKIVGASSDMIVLDLGENSGKYKVGDTIRFDLDYMGTLKILNSRYVDKKLIPR